MRNIVIVGLKRSGTTILWDLLRDCDNFIGYDEPFHPKFWAGEKINSKNSWQGLVEFRKSNPEIFHGDNCAIEPQDEPRTYISPKQKDFFSSLLATGPCVIDSVRIWSKAYKLIPDDGSTVVVHLIRNPIGWTTAHLWPSQNDTLRGKLVSKIREMCFFWRKRGFDFWSYEKLFNHALVNSSLFEGSLLSNEDLSKARAFEKLLAIWFFANMRINHAMRRFEENETVTVTLEGLSENPDDVVSQIVSMANSQCTPDTHQVGSVRRGHKIFSPRWDKILKTFGIEEGGRIAETFSSYGTNELLEIWARYNLR